jgi:hypothetical protein
MQSCTSQAGHDYDAVMRPKKAVPPCYLILGVQSSITRSLGVSPAALVSGGEPVCGPAAFFCQEKL